MALRLLVPAAIFAAVALTPSAARGSEFVLNFDDLMAATSVPELESGYIEGGPLRTTILYTNTVDHLGSFRFNPGAAGSTTPADAMRAAYDDVPIPNAVLAGNTAVDIRRITVGIRRLANAPATDVTVLLTTLTTGPAPPDTEIDIPAIIACTVNLPANGATAVTTPISCGDGIDAIFPNFPVNSSVIPGFGSIAVGVRLSNTDGRNGWRVTDGPDANANVFWQHDPNHTGQPTDEAAYVFSNSMPPNPPATFWIQVEGKSVPEPASAGLFGLGIAVMLIRKR